MRYVLAAALASLGGEEPVVWVFFSPRSPDASALFRDLDGARVRPALLCEGYLGGREPTEAFFSTVRAAGEMLVVDEEALRMARRLGIRELPAVAVVRGDRIHLASGTRVDVKELLRCAR